MRNVIFSVLLALFLNTSAQDFVSNPSFEDTVSCPTNIGQLIKAQFWVNPTQGSPDCFNSCSTNNGNVAHVPDNGFGFQNAHTGNGYAGFYAGGACLGTPNGREYVQTALSSAMTAGAKYFVSFFVSLSNGSSYATSNIGAYVSASAPMRSDAHVITATPQIENNQGFITDTLNWIRISGMYLAQGGEQYITIGNFYDDVNTDTLRVQWGTPCYYYYIDDVSVIDSTSLAIFNNREEGLVNVFPNPANSVLNIETRLQDAEVKISDVLGNVLLSGKLNYKKQIDIIEFARGVYFLQLQEKGKIYTCKFVKE